MVYFFYKQDHAYDMPISDWSSDVCSSDLLEIRHLRRITRVDQRLEAGLDQFDRAAAQHRLFAEQIRFGLVLERGLDDAGPATTDRRGIRQRDLQIGRASCRERVCQYV